MNDALYVAASGMETVQRMLDTAAHNAVNNQTPGYQRHEIISRSFGAFLDQASGRENLVGGEEVIIFQQGEMHPSDHPYAMALMGEGFFVVESPDGGEHFTRNGQFAVDGSGRLTTSAGYPVKGEGGPIVIDPLLGNVAFEVDGAVIQGGSEIGRIRMVEFSREDRDRLTKSGESLYAAPNGVIPAAAQSTTVHHGSLEIQSFGMKGTVKMLLASKNFDAMQRTIRTIDEVQQQLIRSVQ